MLLPFQQLLRELSFLLAPLIAPVQRVVPILPGVHNRDYIFAFFWQIYSYCIFYNVFANWSISFCDIMLTTNPPEFVPTPRYFSLIWAEMCLMINGKIDHAILILLQFLHRGDQQAELVFQILVGAQFHGKVSFIIENRIRGG